jgi:hypothetical protein
MLSNWKWRTGVLAMLTAACIAGLLRVEGRRRRRRDAWRDIPPEREVILRSHGYIHQDRRAPAHEQQCGSRVGIPLESRMKAYFDYINDQGTTGEDRAYRR